MPRTKTRARTFEKLSFRTGSLIRKGKGKKILIISDKTPGDPNGPTRCELMLYRTSRISETRRTPKELTVLGYRIIKQFSLDRMERKIKKYARRRK